MVIRRDFSAIKTKKPSYWGGLSPVDTQRIMLYQLLYKLIGRAYLKRGYLRS